MHSCTAEFVVVVNSCIGLFIGSKAMQRYDRSRQGIQSSQQVCVGEIDTS